VGVIAEGVGTVVPDIVSWGNNGKHAGTSALLSFTMAFDPITVANVSLSTSTSVPAPTRVLSDPTVLLVRPALIPTAVFKFSAVF
jgi:hypothetical protein